jgi:hypothetical protein
VSRIRFYVFDDAGRSSFTMGVAALDRVLNKPDEPLGDLIERIADLDYRWGTSDGN